MSLTHIANMYLHDVETIGQYPIIHTIVMLANLAVINSTATNNPACWGYEHYLPSASSLSNASALVGT